MKPIKIVTPKFEFTLDDDGSFRMDTLPCICPWESGFTGFIKTQGDRVALGRFLMEVGTKLATPKGGKLS